MKNPKRKLFGHTWVGWLNILIIQLFFIRLSYGDKWTIIWGILPFTGWWSNYIYVYKREV